MKHYTKGELELYRNGKMSVLGRISCSGHLHSCSECAKLMKELQEEDLLIDDLRSSIRLYRELTDDKISQTE